MDKLFKSYTELEEKKVENMLGQHMEGCVVSPWS